MAKDSDTSARGIANTAQRNHREVWGGRKHHQKRCNWGCNKKKGCRASDEVEIYRADACNGGSPEVEAAEGKQGTLRVFRVPQTRLLGLLLGHEAAVAPFGLEEGEVSQSQALQFGEVQFRDGHSPVKEGIILGVHGVPHFFLGVGEREEEQERGDMMVLKRF